MSLEVSAWIYWLSLCLSEPFRWLCTIFLVSLEVSAWTYWPSLCPGEPFCWLWFFVVLQISAWSDYLLVESLSEWTFLLTLQYLLRGPWSKCMDWLKWLVESLSEWTVLLTLHYLFCGPCDKCMEWLLLGCCVSEPFGWLYRLLTLLYLLRGPWSKCMADYWLSLCLGEPFCWLYTISLMALAVSASTDHWLSFSLGEPFCWVYGITVSPWLFLRWVHGLWAHWLLTLCSIAFMILQVSA